MPLPPGCHVEGGELVFYELASEETLADETGLYEHTCFVACTNGLRPLGAPAIVRFEYPAIDPDEVIDWGGRSITPDLLEVYRREGYLLCQLRLPVAPMGGPLPEGAPPPPEHHAPADPAPADTDG